MDSKLLHDRVEERFNLSKRLESVEAFQSLLAAFYGYYSPVEDRLAGYMKDNPIGIDFTSRQKTPLIIADLHCWNIAVEDLPICEDLPEIDSHAAAFGCMYVMEGATLGGQIIKRVLEQKLSITSNNGGSFFTAYGDRVGVMWNDFRETLSRYAISHPQNDEQIVNAALEIFATFDAWLGQQLP
jgi:heme oxygenase